MTPYRNRTWNPQNAPPVDVGKLGITLQNEHLIVLQQDDGKSAIYTNAQNVTDKQINDILLQLFDE